MGRPTTPRPKTPLKLALVKGEQKSKLNFDEPVAEEGIPQCPVIDKQVRDVWNYTIDALRKMGILSLADRDPLLAYCQAVVAHRRASQELDNLGYMVTTETGVYPNPAVRIQRESALLMRQFAAEFGLTPAARTRIRVGDQKPKEEKGAARLLG